MPKPKPKPARKSSAPPSSGPVAAPKPIRLTPAEAREFKVLKTRLRGLERAQQKALERATVAKTRTVTLRGEKKLAKAVVTTRNRILRQATPDTALQAIGRVKARIRARADQYAAALKKARVTKRDRGQTVIFDTLGRRYPDMQAVPGKIKVFMMSVGPRGGRRLFNPDDPNTIMRGAKAQPMPLTRSDFKFDKLLRIAPRKFQKLMQAEETKARRKAGVGPITAEEVAKAVERTAPVDVGRTGDIAQFYTKAKQAYVAKVREFQDLTSWGFEILVSLQGDGRVLRLSTDKLPAHNFFKVVPQGRTGRRIVFRNNATSPRALERSIEFHANEAIRAELRVRGMVSQGSATRISRLPFNKGLAKSKWLDKNGAKWRGADLQTVRIRRIQFRLFRIV